MASKTLIRQGAVWTCAAAVCLSSLGAAQVFAQPPTAPGGATTVEAVTAIGLVPVPNVGAGATSFTIEELQDTAKAARSEYLDTRRSAESCGVTIGLRGTAHFRAEDYVEPRMPAVQYLGGVYATLRDANNAIWRAAQEAEFATAASIDARARAARGQAEMAEVESTELARQAAVKAMQEAQRDIIQAQGRLLDAQQFVQDNPNAKAREARTYVEFLTQERERTGGGVAGVYTPDMWKDLRLSEVSARDVEVNGAHVLRISGRVHNTRRRQIGVPPLWFTAVDRFNTPLKSATAQPGGRTRIPAGGSVPFSYDLAPSPEKAASAVVTFAPDHQVAFELPAGYLCAAAPQPDTG